MLNLIKDIREEAIGDHMKEDKEETKELGDRQTDRPVLQTRILPHQ
jgi:hypothetical protein